ncbi:MAG: uroporphyrinogen-III C-methyltransferase [Candidatus Choladocola sp.]|nr:uroporphyrinogen-III C-methyltransferase [Candidatus Choladocola sp.]
MKNEKNTGRVWLVGAGPSDPGLFTIKGKEVLEQADVVVYDALAGQSIRNMIPEDAEAIDVGKRSSHHTMVQEKINELLVEKAREGKRVVRLKGGDPFLFGRGGEELELLVKEGIPYEIVPGVTSALAVPAYQGIPVTHRDYCSSVHLITGHKRAGKAYDIDFEALVRTKGTLVFLMGVASLGDICHGLLAGGMDPDRPAALLMQGTTAAQDRVVATVSTLEEAVSLHGAKTPAIIVVGDVCRLAEQFSWYEKLPLGGVKVLLTRPKELISETARKLRQKGAEVLELPAIRTVPRKDNTALVQALEHLQTYHWVVFTSPTGVRIFFDEMKKKRMDLRRLAGVKIASIGSGTCRELEKYGLYSDLVPEIFDGEHLGMALATVCTTGERILIPRAAEGNQELISLLLEKTPYVDDVPTYDTVYESGRFDDVRAELENGNVDYVIFTSASTVRGFAAAVGDTDFTKIRAVCIGRQTKAAADAFGMQTWMAEQPSIDSLTERLIQVQKESRE